MKPSLQVRLSQHLALTPQLQQSIRLLQLSTLELHQEVEQMLEQNPFLEPDDDGGGGEALPERVQERLGEAERSVQREESEDRVQQAPETADDAPGLDAAELGTTARDDWENGTEAEDFDGIGELPAPRSSDPDSDDLEASDRNSPGITLQDHLREQLRGMRLAQIDRAAVLVLIESLTDDGYLDGSLDEIADQLLGRGIAPLLMGNGGDPDGQSLGLDAIDDEAGKGNGDAGPDRIDARANAELAADAAPRHGPLNGKKSASASAKGRSATAVPTPTVALHTAADDDDAPDTDPERTELIARLRCGLRWLQCLDPIGVGAANLSDCLVLQLRAKPVCDARQIALVICAKHLELLARRDSRKLMAATGADEVLLREAQQMIVSLEPKPGRPFARAEAQIVVPDVIVQKAGRGWKVVLNPDVMPKLRINDLYAQAIRGQRGSSSGLSARLQEARWFMKNILQRFDTIQRVSQAIVERQKGFFSHGEIAMKPLVLREIADELGLHESTISRVTTAKYMSTPYGTFELKYFFGSSLNTETGGNASSTAVRALIKQLVSAEDPGKPLSDSQLSDMLGEQGIQVARRTVAKYREALKIAPANLRKSL